MVKQELEVKVEEMPETPKEEEATPPPPPPPPPSEIPEQAPATTSENKVETPIQNETQEELVVEVKPEGQTSPAIPEPEIPEVAELQKLSEQLQKIREQEKQESNNNQNPQE